MKTSEAIINREVLLEKFPGKGGWTYAKVPEVSPDSKAPFGWVQVKGAVDAYTFQQVKLMPMGNGQLFFPVKATIRKLIGKQAGDTVHLLLFYDLSELIVPEEILLCLKDEPAAFHNFQAFKEGEKKRYLDWINATQNEETKINRIAQLIERAKSGLNFDEKP
ncbi:MAG: YdeI/OmpD-associated family protein [Saprospiraceae bacterium]